MKKREWVLFVGSLFISFLLIIATARSNPIMSNSVSPPMRAYCSQNFLSLNGGVVSGNVQLNMAKIITTSQPTCDVNERGSLSTTFGALGVADTIQICSKNALNLYAWRVISVA